MAERRMQKSEEAVQAVRPVPAAGGPAEDADTIDLIELMYRLIAGWKLIVCLTFVFVLAAGLATEFIITPMYDFVTVKKLSYKA